jgi:flagellar basal body-associated protein FliL
MTANPAARPRVGAQFASPADGYLSGMDPASIFIIVVVLVVAAGLGVFFFFTSAGLEMREGRRRRRHERPEHLRVENEQQAVSSPVRSPRPPGPEADANPHN